MDVDLELSQRTKLQQESFARALRDKDKHTLLYFYSSACKLCRSINSVVNQEHAQRIKWLNLATVCTDGTQGFAPEMLNYDVQSVPCFVLLKPGGHAIAKSGKPHSQGHVTAALEELLSLVTPPPAEQHSSKH